jgi:hypothetical protein
MKINTRALIPFSVIAIAMLALGCANSAKFPVSTITPAAEISATKSKDRNNNYVIEVSTKNMASADRLSPSMNNYSVWLVTDNDGTKNLGQLDNKNGKNASLKATTPFNGKEIYITAEPKGDNTYPSGIEISRGTFKK